MKSISFKAEMVRAILEGRKTQTRRLVKPSAHMKKYVKKTWGSRIPTDAEWNDMAGNAAKALLGQGEYGPYGKPGDRLWVRETIICPEDSDPYYAADMTVLDMPAIAARSRREKLGFRIGTVSSIHCPRWASRITLEITGVRVERLQDISDDDALAEGINQEWTIGHDIDIDGQLWPGAAIRKYRALWESINGKDSWDANPLVWVIEFKRVEAK